jgi:hypothetical protein
MVAHKPSLGVFGVAVEEPLQLVACLLERQRPFWKVAADVWIAVERKQAVEIIILEAAKSEPIGFKDPPADGHSGAS